MIYALLLAASYAVAADQPAAQTMKDWVFVELRDGGTVAVRREDYEAALAKAKAGQPHAFETAQAYRLAFAPDKAGAPLTATATDPKLTLKIYPPSAAGVAYAVCPTGKDCSGGEPAEISARPCNAAACSGLTIDRPELKRAGTRLEPADAERPLALTLDGKPFDGRSPAPAKAIDQLKTLAKDGATPEAGPLPGAKEPALKAAEAPVVNAAAGAGGGNVPALTSNRVPGPDADAPKSQSKGGLLGLVQDHPWVAPVGMAAFFGIGGFILGGPFGAVIGAAVGAGVGWGLSKLF
jgi:hypothetical protein